MKIFKRGFTLIEVLIVVLIIAVLSVIAFAFFGNDLTKQAKKIKGIEDVNAIAKALEVNYDPQTRLYREVIGSDFSSGVLPTAPEGAYYIATLSSDGQGFRVCANLSDETQCSSSSCYCFCISSSRGEYNETSYPTPFYP